MDLKVCSLNVRGLGDRLKRREMFNWLRKKNYSIYMTLIHLFWTCSVSTLFWQDFKQWAVTRGELSNTINLTAYLVLGLNPNKNKRLDFYFLITRYFLWVCKTNNTFPKNVISDGWVTKERISQKLLFWWHDWEVLVFSRESFEYLMF